MESIIERRVPDEIKIKGGQYGAKLMGFESPFSSALRYVEFNASDDDAEFLMSKGFDVRSAKDYGVLRNIEARLTDQTVFEYEVDGRHGEFRLWQANEAGAFGTAFYKYFKRPSIANNVTEVVIVPVYRIMPDYIKYPNRFCVKKLKLSVPDLDHASWYDTIARYTKPESF